MPALNPKYLLATIMLGGRIEFVSAQSWERMLGYKSVQETMSKVNIVEDQSQEAAPGEPRIESARVSVEETSGQQHEVFIPFVKDCLSHPMGKEEVDEKVLKLMAPYLSTASKRGG